MTFAVFIVLFLGFFIAALNALPPGGALPIQFAQALTAIVSSMKAWNALFPISDLLYCSLIVLGYEFALWVVHALQWVIRVIRGTNSGA